MGMTIDTAITVLGMVEAHGICIEAKDIAVETMRKYQKIVPALVNYDLLNPIADVKTIDGEGIYINLSDLQDYMQKVIENDNTK